ncbi:TetR-like C-terminal domain-containing protein [Paenarthrobacter sp. NPDC091669]|uniref:TetR-like C-terminal domain-containing protein n=1 Tax=Paenarthrobacter sp. NPDC091669 TaxID=3364384 RepID=UPI0037F9857D
MSPKRGRPYNLEIGTALRQAAERVMSEGGFSSLTIDGLVNEVGTTRPSFYRRYRNVAHLAFDVIQHRFGTQPHSAGTSLAKDLLQLQRDEVAMFADPLVRNNLPGLLESMRTDSHVRELYLEGFIKPRRANVMCVLNAAIDRGEVQGSDVDLNWICDLLLSPVLTRALLPTPGGLNDELARRTADLALRELTSNTFAT